jgi:hypothetical protein
MGVPRPNELLLNEQRASENAMGIIPTAAPSSLSPELTEADVSRIGTWQLLDLTTGGNMEATLPKSTNV